MAAREVIAQWRAPGLLAFACRHGQLEHRAAGTAFPVNSISLPQYTFVFANKIMQSGVKILPPGPQLGRLAKASGYNLI